jgi:hypothetical protein
MVWGDMSTAPWWNAARNAYGPTSSKADQQQALEVSLAAGVNFNAQQLASGAPMPVLLA